MNQEKIELNEEICEFVGAFIGDGYMGNYGERKNRFVVGFAGNKILDEDYLKNYLLPLIKRQFPYTNPRLGYRPDQNTLMLRMYSQRLFHFMNTLGFKAGRKSRTVTIPEVFYKSNRDGKRNTLEIYGHRQLERFLKLIGFSNQKHLSKIVAPVA